MANQTQCVTDEMPCFIESIIAPFEKNATDGEIKRFGGRGSSGLRFFKGLQHLRVARVNSR